MTRLLTFAMLLATAGVSALPVAINPRTPEIDVSSNMTRPHVAAASNGRTFIVTWEDRAALAPPESGDLYFRTYSETGTPDQQTPLLAMNDAFAPAVVWNGSEWVIAGSFTFTPVAGLDQPVLRAARIDEHGGAIGNQLVVASGQTPPSLTTGMASNGSGLLIGNGSTVLTARDLSSPHAFRFHVKPLAATGGTFLTIDDTNHLAVVSSNGVTLSSTLLAAGSSVAATANGSEYGVVIANGEIVEGMTLASVGSITSRQTLQANANAAQPAITFSGPSYLAAWALPNQLCSQRFTLSSIGTVQCELRPATPNSISLAAGFSTTLLAWSETVLGTRTDVVRTRYYAGGAIPQLASENVVTGVSGTQRFPRIEKTVGGVTVRWTEPGLDSKLVSTILTEGGQLRALSSVSSGSVLLSDARVRMAHASGGTLAVWPQATSVMAQFVRDDGSNEPPFLLGDGHDPDIASDGTDWLVVWQTNAATSQIASTIVTASRTVATPGGTLLARSSSAQRIPAIASRGTDYLVAWNEVEAANQLMALAVTPSGNATGGVFDLAATQGAIQQIQLAQSGGIYLIVVQNEAGDIGFPIAENVPGIFVAGVAPDQPWRVRGNDDGFALLEGSPIRTRFIDFTGHDRIGGTLPLDVSDFDFVYDGPRLILAYEQADGYLSSKVFLDSFAPRMRALR